ncbi:hypothetical protein CTM62_00350 [Prevotella intermedia]|uniref:Uncharacterized protein n=1 Tax=Prevotella intermedia TaxID=28131 RepID=A0A2D3L425_PREIN|nr:hypothetical protein CTM62_00350 [Prevotella intermedia]
MCGKSVCFALQNRRFRNTKVQLSFFNRNLFTEKRIFPAVTELFYIHSEPSPQELKIISTEEFYQIQLFLR